MTYPRNPDLPETVASAILALAEGDSILLSEPSPTGSEKLRQAIYGWIWVNGLRGAFRIRRESPTHLRIYRKTELHTLIHRVEKAIGPEQEFVLNNLLELEEEKDTLFAIQKGIAEGRLAPDSALRVLEEWRAKVGGTDVSP
uniref:Uncharacterized protein n=1 Tax=viral metagenome TaxID=1070528 RepID=A0A6H2A0N8_9ZZZZ